MKHIFTWGAPDEHFGGRDVLLGGAPLQSGGGGRPRPSDFCTELRASSFCQAVQRAR
jgi:hypothetical protein